MTLHRKPSFWVPALLFGVVFLTLFGMRLDVWTMIGNAPRSLTLETASLLEGKDDWMSIYQEDQKIGYAHKRLSQNDTGYRVEETVLMRINTMGLMQEVRLNTLGLLNPDFTLDRFKFQIHSGRFSYQVEGRAAGRNMLVTTTGAESERSFEVALEEPSYLVNGLLDVIRTKHLKPGQHWKFQIFDPGTLGQAEVSIEVIGREAITRNDISVPATKILVTFKGTTQLAWLDENGDILQEEGLLGIRMVKTDRTEALAGISNRPGRDLTRVASVGVNRDIADPAALQELTVVIDRVALDNFHLKGGRQSLVDRTLTIRKESLADLPQKQTREELGTLEKIFLEPSPFIQSDHPAIVAQAAAIVDPENGDALQKARQIIDWMQNNIAKRPVLSVPDALTTLKNRVGDCNEHAVLLAALARAAGIPARVEAGLVYLNGRFYYHAWNLLYLGRWVTADALFGQLPADVTHIRFATGTHKQLDLMGLMGKVALKIVE